MTVSPMHLLLALQGFVVLFLATHDWIPLGSLNDVESVQAADSRAKLVAVTALSTLPYAIGLLASIRYAHAGFPHWLSMWLWCSYAAMACGILRAWWIPYLLIEDPVRAARYRMFDRTHAFLPEHNGIRPNTLHVSLHAAIVAIIILLATAT